MFTLDDLLHPVTPAEFRESYADRAPLHIPAGADDRKRKLLDWAAFNGLLNQTNIWDPTTLMLVRDRVAIPYDQFFAITRSEEKETIKVSPAKVEVFLSAGCSLVANDVTSIHPPIAALAHGLSQAWGGYVGANVYCSFQGVQAFGPHFDIHDVFAVQTEGEKVWRIYQGRETNPLEMGKNADENKRRFDRNKGPLLHEITMRAGDVLYLPRGWYHDALARDGESLHVTLSITPLSGPWVMKAVHALALQDDSYRAWLPPAHEEGGEPLRVRLAEIGRLYARLAESPELFHDIAMAQQTAVHRPAGFSLPVRKPVTLMRVTGTAFPPGDPAIDKAWAWAKEERVFAIEDMVAQFTGLQETTIREAVEAARAAGALAPQAR
jgi:ribosomal protein L16 Arg81 hydroxylase